MFSFVRTVDRNTDVGSLFGSQLGEVNSDALQVQAGYFLVKLLRQTVYVNRIVVVEQFNLCQCLVGE